MQQPAYHVHIYGPPRLTDLGSVPADAVKNRGQSTEQGQQSTIATTFENAMARLQDLTPSVLTEPDGSIAWAGTEHQIVGIIYDAADQIQYVELRGHGQSKYWRLLLQAIAGTENVDRFSIMVLPNRQWKNFQSFERMLDENAS
ncbi:hypothetical protein [Roseiconus lacunae]|uniref:Uncharacterized protein n=1 Tax=Roseiconus lacunae TaxID=2605694 RepID=A0ABT7PBN9_9BACT|nr:hypothetical protein [Roseiconus lacunae]MCD0463084.1 hypothetical protein [Roseiconus lacunae]MDM4013866.1 hypothetical protein [Roseiconus lacunae]